MYLHLHYVQSDKTILSIFYLSFSHISSKQENERYISVQKIMILKHIMHYKISKQRKFLNERYFHTNRSLFSRYKNEREFKMELYIKICIYLENRHVTFL